MGFRKATRYLGYSTVVMNNLETYRASQDERDRTEDLLRLLPRSRSSVLDIGARDGHFSRLLTEYFPHVTALDLERPRFEIPGVETVAGDVTKLDFASDSFDCVFCAEVLEHIPEIQKACNEIVRVTRHEIIVGVPFKQDLRVDRSTCYRCRKANPAWGHVNSFDLSKLLELFSGLQLSATSFVGTTRESSNPLSAYLMDIAGNPWGTYDQDELCIYCGSHLIPPESRHLWQRGLSSIAVRINRLQAIRTFPHAKWIHLLFSKRIDQRQMVTK
jgi:SAM-dependent methyltransferase